MNENEIKKMQGDVILTHIAVDLIDPSKDNRLSEKGRVQLIQSVKTEGILNPIYVLATENGRYEVVAGERRRLSAKEFGLESIPCFVCKDTDQVASRSLRSSWIGWTMNS